MAFTLSVSVLDLPSVGPHFNLDLPRSNPLTTVGLTNGVTASLTLGYAIDCYRELSGEVMIAVIIVRNSLSFAIGYSLTPWLNLGLQNTFISAAFVGMAITMTFIPVIIWGKAWRRMTKERFYKYCQTSSVQSLIRTRSELTRASQDLCQPLNGIKMLCCGVIVFMGESNNFNILLYDESSY